MKNDKNNESKKGFGPILLLSRSISTGTLQATIRYHSGLCLIRSRQGIDQITRLFERTSTLKLPYLLVLVLLSAKYAAFESRHGDFAPRP